MARISFPLGFKIIDNSGLSDTGQAIDERSVFASSTDRTNYTSNFLYRGLLSYTIGTPYHISGVSDNSGYYTRYYNGATYSWVGLNAHTVDDKDAYGTMDSATSSYTDPEDGSNIVDHVNYLYALTSALSSGRTWKAPVTAFSDLATTYPTPSAGWSALVTLENSIYTYDGSTWVKTNGSIPSLSSTISGIISYTWYNALYDFVTAYNDNSSSNKYLNKDSYRSIVLQNSGSTTGTLTSDSTGSFTISAINGITLSSPAPNLIVIDGSNAGGSAITLNEVPYGTGTGLTSSSTFKYNTSNYYLDINNGNGTVAINADTSGYGYFPIINSLNTILSTGFSFENTYSVVRSVLIGSDLINQQSYVSNSVLIGNSVGYGLSEDVLTNRFLLSTSTDSGATESNLLDGTFPATGSSSSYGSLKIRGSIYVKETDVIIDRVINGGYNDLTFTDNHAGTVTLNELKGATPVSNFLYWNSSSKYYQPYSSTQTFSSLSSEGSPYSGAPTSGYLNYNGSLVVGSTNTSFSNIGIEGYSYSSIGVSGTSYSSHGIVGSSISGFGVYGVSGSNYGVSGESTSNYGVYADSVSATLPALYAVNINSNIAIDTSGSIYENGYKLVATQTGNSGKVLSTNGTRTEWINISANQTLFDVPHYYRAVLDTNTIGDIRIYYNSTGRYTDQWNGSAWVNKETYLW